MSAFVEAGKQESKSSHGVDKRTAATFADAVGSILNTLVTGVDRLGWCHESQSAAQDDERGRSMFGRTGISLRDFSTTWDKLDMRESAMQFTSSASRDCSNDCVSQPATQTESTRLTNFLSPGD